MAALIIEKQTPAQRMAPAEQQVHVSGGKVIVFDGKKDVELGKEKAEPAKAKDGTDGTKGTDGKPADEAKAGEKKELSGLDALRKSLGFWKEEKKAEEKKVDAAAEAKAKDGTDGTKGTDGKAAEAKADEADGDRDGKGRFTKRTRSSITPELVETMAQTAARAAVEANRASKTEKQEAPADPAEGLSASDQRDLTVLSYMAKSDERYKGIDKQFLKFTKEFGSYQDGWEKENPGKAFNPEDDEHDAFYAKHEPKYDQADFEDARINLQLDARMKDREKQLEERYGKIEAKMLEQDLAPVMDRKAGESIQAMVEAVDPDAAKVLTEKGHEALAEQDPIAFEVLDRTAADMRVLVGELEKLNHPSGRFRFDERNPAHKFLDDFAASLEQNLKRMSFEDQVREGKMFATQAELRGIPEAQRSRYWTLDGSVIREELVKSMAAGAKNVLQAERAKVEKYVKARGLGAAKTTDGEAGKGAAEAKPGAQKPNSPAAATDAGAASAKQVENNSDGSGIKTLVSRLWPS